MPKLLLASIGIGVYFHYREPIHLSLFGTSPNQLREIREKPLGQGEIQEYLADEYTTTLLNNPTQPEEQNPVLSYFSPRETVQGGSCDVLQEVKDLLFEALGFDVFEEVQQRALDMHTSVIQAWREFVETGNFHDMVQSFQESTTEAKGHLKVSIEEASEEISSIVDQSKDWKESITANFTIPDLVLPDPLPFGQPPITLVVDLEIFYNPAGPELIRGGALYFLSKAHEFAEIVVVSDTNIYFLTGIIDELDPPPAHKISYRVGAQQWKNITAGYPRIRDLDKLNRDLSTVVVLDHSAKAYPRHQENVLVLPREVWWADPGETDLYDIVPLIGYISELAKRKHDVREIIPKYEGIDPSALVRHVMVTQSRTRLEKKGSQKIDLDKF